jgi:hypothetical protein
MPIKGQQRSNNFTLLSFATIAGYCLLLLENITIGLYGSERSRFVYSNQQAFSIIMKPIVKLPAWN